MAAHCQFVFFRGGRSVWCEETKYLDASGFCMCHCEFGLREEKVLDDMMLRDEPTVKLMAFSRSCRHHYEEFHGKPPRKQEHSGNGAYKGAFAFTLTKSPDDELTEEDMIKAVKKVMNQNSIPTSKFAWYLEYGDSALKLHPHIHGMYETADGGMIETKHWKRAWPIWNPKQKLGHGFRGGYHRPVRDNESYDDYIQKDKGQCERFNC